MEDSILISTKKILGLDFDYTAFDLDVITHINSAFSTLNQLGVGPVNGFFIEDDTAVWSDISDLPPNQLHMVKTYIQLKVRSVFDPPQAGYAITAMQEQIREFEWRLNILREVALPDPDPEVPLDVILDGGGP